MEPRALAAHILTEVVERKQPLDKVLAQHLPTLGDPSARAFTQELCYGVLRWYGGLDALSRRLLHKPVKDGTLHQLVLIGLYQLIYTRVAAHAAVDQTVNAAVALNKPWAKGMLNAVLRTYTRDSARLLSEIERDPAAASAHPPWLLAALQQDWPAQWAEIAAAANERPPFSLRVNARQGSRADYLQCLAEAGIEATPLPFTTHGVRLPKPLAVEALPGWAAGQVSVQDGAAQQAAALLGAQAGERVLDACAAPGGKLCHILEVQPEVAELTALDIEAARMARVRQNLERLRLSATLVTGDAARPADWWDGRPYDRILLDAPCSATGVIRRHPDIKLLRGAQDVEAALRTQKRLLSALWPLLKSGGTLLYATCSVLARENEQQVRDFLDTHASARADAFILPWQQGRHATLGRQILTGEQGMDGFYYARLLKA